VDQQEVLRDIRAVRGRQLKLFFLQQLHGELENLALPHLHLLPHRSTRAQLCQLDLVLEHDHVLFPGL
jgi:hypothetical protein